MCLRELTFSFAEYLPKLSSQWEFKEPFPKLPMPPEDYGCYNPLSAHIMKQVFGDSGLYKARTWKEMSKILDGKFPAVGDLIETPYISPATIAYVHALILHSPYYSRDDKNIKGKIEEYYERELQDIGAPSDQDFALGTNEMFKDYYCWVNKDPTAGYKPGMDFYDQGPPVAGAAAAPASPAASKNRPKASPVPSPGKAAAAAAAAAATAPEPAAVSPADETAPAAGGDAGGAKGKKGGTKGNKSS